MLVSPRGNISLLILSKDNAPEKKINIMIKFAATGLRANQPISPLEFKSIILRFRC